MSSRSRDLISATLISAGIVAVGELHMVCNTGTAGTAFRDYWTDWFDNDRWHTSVITAETKLTAGQNDVLLVGLGSNNVTGTLTWNLANTHMVGAGAVQRGRPQSLLQLAGTGAVTPMINVTATGCAFSNLTMRHGRDSGANAGCNICLQISTGAGDFVGRNLFLWGPEDGTIAGTTGGYGLARIGDHSEWYNCQFGYGWPFTGAPGTAANNAALIRFDKSVYNSSTFENCNFVMESTVTANVFIQHTYAAAGGTFWAYRNCAFLQISTSSMQVAISSDQAGMIWAVTASGKMYFDANTYFVGVTDVAAAANENHIFFPPQQLASTGTGDRALKVGLGQSFDHTE